MKLGSALHALAPIIALFVCVSMSPTLTYASEATSRNATAEEITGNWRLLPLPDELEPKILKTNPWPQECQWYSYSSSGELKSFDKMKGPCENISSVHLEDVTANIPSVQSWKYDLSPTYHQGLLLVDRKDVTNYMEAWDPRITTKAFSNGGVDFQEGDLVLYLVDIQTHQIKWIRHLRHLE